MNFIDVVVPLPIRTTFTYLVSQKEYDFLDLGFRVMVPFGKSKYITGIVISKHKKIPSKYQAKEIEYIIDKETRHKSWCEKEPRTSDHAPVRILVNE